MVARLDSHNDLADLILDIRDAVDKRGRREGARRHPPPPAPGAAGGDGGGDGARRRPPVSGPSRRSRGWDENDAETRWNVSAFVKYSFQ